MNCKDKINQTKKFGNAEIVPLIQFSKIEWKGCFSVCLIFSANLPVEKAVATSYLLATIDHPHDTATYVHESILTAFRKSKEMAWPPVLEDVQQMASEPLLEELECFLFLVFSGSEPEMVQDVKTKRFVYSISLDICREVSLEKWKLEKHILICTTLLHLYRSKQLTTILNCACLCESYSFGIELETAMANALEETSTYLIPQIDSGDCNEVFHSGWDNMNKSLTNLTGFDVANSTSGLMLQ